MKNRGTSYETMMTMKASGFLQGHYGRAAQISVPTHINASPRSALARAADRDMGFRPA